MVYSKLRSGEMNINEGNNDDKGFVLQLMMRAEQKVKEYAETMHEIRRLQMRAERDKDYIEQLNNFIRAEGQQPISIKETPPLGSGVGRPGNRAKGLPLRKMQWDGMTMNEIIVNILNASPEVSFHHTEIASLIYEIDSDSDLRKVLPNLRSAMQKGKRDGLWESTNRRGRFTAKVAEKQWTLVDA